MGTLLADNRDNSMRISIWQQFSSNHSSGFQVVGKFESIELAQKAAITLQDMLRLIMEARNDYESEDPTPPEIGFAELYKVEWTKSLDWIANEKAQVMQFDEYVFCGNVFRVTWLGASPINEILQKLGSIQICIGETNETRDTLLVVKVTCTAPSLKIARSISTDIGDYLERARRIRFTADDPPWREYGQPIHKIGNVPYWEDGVSFGYVEKSYRNLIFNNLHFWHLGCGLKGLLKYLQARGCKDIDYRIEECPEDTISHREPPK